MIIISKAKDVQIVIGLLMVRRNLEDMKTLGANVSKAITVIDEQIKRYRIEVLKEEVMQ